MRKRGEREKLEQVMGIKTSFLKGVGLRGFSQQRSEMGRGMDEKRMPIHQQVHWH